MKIVSNSDVQHVGTVNKNIDFGIDKENIGILFRGFSDTLYSNKIGSIVREVTSNCFDSHREANIKDDVVITMADADPLTGKNGKISFKDVGVGLSPTRIQDIYSKYFSSTKRETNNEIGGFGIGAKSPLAYTDVFEVNTIYEGIKYYYVVHRGDKVPHIKLINQEPSTEHNGTEVILPVRAGDEETFRRECKHQLRFFSNIHYINMGIDNDYQIVKGKDWIASGITKGQRTDYRLSICLGGVSYPLNTDQLSYGDWKGYDKKPHMNMYENTTVALNFEVGEIDVTMSRESIEYNDRTILAIQKKYVAVQKELLAMYDKSWEKITDFRDYFLNTNKRRGSTMLPLKEDLFVDISFCVDSNAPPKFTPWDMVVEANDLNMILKTYEVSDGKRSTKKYDNYASHLIKEYDLDSWFRKQDKLNKVKSDYIQEEIIDGYSFVCVELQPEPDDWDTRWDNKEGKMKAKYDKLKPLLLKYIIKNTKNYDKIEPPKEWLEERKDSVTSAGKPKVPRSQVCVRYPRWKGEYDKHDKNDVLFSKRSTNYLELQGDIERGKTIIYDVMENEMDIKMLSYILYGTPLANGKGDTYQGLLSPQTVDIHKIAKSHVKHYEAIGALTIKQFIIKHYNTLIGVHWGKKLFDIYSRNTFLYDKVLDIFPRHLVDFLEVRVCYWKNTHANYPKVYGNLYRRRSYQNDENVKEYVPGMHERYLKELMDKYKIPFILDNHTFFWGENSYHSKSLYDLLKEVTSNLEWMDKFIDVKFQDLKREYNPEDPQVIRGLEIIKEIPRRNYKTIMYKINNYFKNE